MISIIFKYNLEKQLQKINIKDKSLPDDDCKSVINCIYASLMSSSCPKVGAPTLLPC